MKILVYRARSKNGVLTAMASGLAHALAGQGATVEVAPFWTEDRTETVIRSVNEIRPDFAVSFSSFGGDIEVDGRSVFAAAGAGFVGWDVDHPAYQVRRFATPIPGRVQACASASHLAFLRAMGCETAGWLTLPAVEAVDEDPMPIEERPIALLAAMSWLGEPNVWWSNARGSLAFNLIEGMVERALADPAADLLAAYHATLKDLSIKLPMEASVANLIAGVGLFVRQYDRVKLARALARSDLPCLILGEGWKDRLGERPGLRFGGDLEAPDLAKLYGRARVVLNLNAANGASERALAAMAAGAVVVSDASPLLQTEFGWADAIRFLDRAALDSAPEVIAATLAEPDAQLIAEQGRALVEARHLWSHRAARLIDLLEGISRSDG